MVTKAENDLLTRVEGDAPMGRLIRERYWIPFMRAARVEPGGRPIKVRLVGGDYVVFRALDGRVGFIDEACPHRRASMALARNEGCGLRCIFHGWVVDVSGKVTEAPSQRHHAEEFASKVPVRRYDVREAGGLLWVWLDAYKGGEAPPFPDFEFTNLPDDHLWVSTTPIACNWLQGLEATVDSVHVNILHQSWVSNIVNSQNAVLQKDLPPLYQFERRNYGVRHAALRDLPDGSVYARVGEFVMPFYGFAGSTNAANGQHTLFISVPVDDENSILIFMRFASADREPLENGPGFRNKPEIEASYNLDNFAPVPGPASDYWGQNYEAIRNGHHTGFDQNLLVEDIVVQVSMGPITDRTKEFLSSSDAAVMEVRRMLLKAAKSFEAGEDWRTHDDGIDYLKIRATSGMVPEGGDWREGFEHDRQQCQGEDQSVGKQLA